MRISDWSSDVCSSDLFVLSAGTRHNPTVIVSTESRRARNLVAGACRPARLPAVPARVAGGTGGARDRGRARVAARAVLRSEEHTSELQSLMRISYAVFCLKNKTKQRHLATTSII